MIVIEELSNDWRRKRANNIVKIQQTYNHRSRQQHIAVFPPHRQRWERSFRDDREGEELRSFCFRVSLDAWVFKATINIPEAAFINSLAHIYPPLSSIFCDVLCAATNIWRRKIANFTPTNVRMEFLKRNRLKEESSSLVSHIMWW